MKKPLLLAAVMLLTSSAFAQARPPLESSHPVAETQTRPQLQPNFRFHVHRGGSCCSAPDFAPSSDDYASPSVSVEIVEAQGDPDWQSSNFMPFPQAVSAGQQQAAITPGKPNAAMVQQMVELYQQVRAAQEQKGQNGNSAPVKWSDLKPALDPADYRRAPTTFMDYSQALALGKQEEAQAQDPNQTPSLAEAAHDQRESKPAEEKAKVVIKQNADGSPVIVQKKP